MCEGPAKNKTNKKTKTRKNSSFPWEGLRGHIQRNMFILGFRPMRESVILATVEAEAGGLRV